VSLELDPISSCSKHVSTLQGFQSCNEGMLENPTIKFSYGSLDSRRSPVDGHFKNVKQDMWLHKDKNNVMICICLFLSVFGLLLWYSGALRPRESSLISGKTGFREYFLDCPGCSATNLLTPIFRMMQSDWFCALKGLQGASLTS
jgi:hypothetical protein